MRILAYALGALVFLILIVGIGLQVRPRPFAAYAPRTPAVQTVPLPAGLPAPVERFYRTVYGDEVPVIASVVLTGRATIRPVMNIPLASRFVFVHRTGQDYRHYFEATLFGVPLLRVNEGYVDGESYFESPMGTYYDDPNTNQGANLALWAEAALFPAVLVTDRRVAWAPVDAQTALLYVPFEEQVETFVVRFDPQTGLIDIMEAMRYRSPDDEHKILWMTRNEPGPQMPDVPISATGSATWLDQGRPWATFTVEDAVYNVDVDAFVRERGYQAP